jgi:SAM-dependent methyltransferase
MLPPERAAFFAPFLRDYTQIRDAEGYGYDDDERYRRLPEVDPADPLAWQWRMRAITFAELRRRVLEPIGKRGLRVLDMGSGVGWLSHRLARLGHAPCAVDLNLDARDGLGAAGHYPASWPLLQAEFDHLPLVDAQADVVVFNAALPYSADYRVTLAEALRVLRPGGRLVVMDSPIYRRDASGKQMVAERQAAFERAHGTRSDALPSIGYLTWGMLRQLGRDLGLRWRAYVPWYGWRWALRPWRARLLRQREPSRFALLVAERSNGQ